MKREFELKHLDQIEMGRRIRKQREFLDFTREDLAGYLGVSSKFIADIEYGEKGISIRKLYMLSQILEVSADYILAGERYGNAVDVAVSYTHQMCIRDRNHAGQDAAFDYDHRGSDAAVSWQKRRGCGL